MRILVIDDKPAVLEMLAATLQRDGHEVVGERSGAAAGSARSRRPGTSFSATSGCPM